LAFFLGIAFLVLAFTVRWVLSGFFSIDAANYGKSPTTATSSQNDISALMTAKAIQNAIESYGLLVIIEDIKATFGMDDLSDQEREAIAKCWRLLSVLMVPSRIDSAMVDSQVASKLTYWWCQIHQMNAKEYVDVATSLQQKLEKLGNILMLFPVMVSEKVERMKDDCLKPEMAMISSKIVMFINDFVPQLVKDNPFNVITTIDFIVEESGRRASNEKGLR
jgi:hypothetical protein